MEARAHTLNESQGNFAVKNSDILNIEVKDERIKSEDGDNDI
jgi:hypothetical protein